MNYLDEEKSYRVQSIWSVLCFLILGLWIGFVSGASYFLVTMQEIKEYKRPYYTTIDGAVTVVGKVIVESKGRPVNLTGINIEHSGPGYAIGLYQGREIK